MPSYPIRAALLSSEISYYQSARDRTGKKYKIADILRVIRDGKNLAQLTADVRNLSGEAQAAAKEALPAVTWSGLFTQRRADLLARHSSLVCLDVDHLPKDGVNNAKDWIATSPHVVAIFISPRGAGLKVLIAVAFHDGAALAHGAAWQTCANYLKDEYGYTADPSGKDVCRLCFLSSDPGLYVATDVEPLAVDPRAAGAVMLAPASGPLDSPEAIETALRQGPLVLPDITLDKAAQVLGFLTPDCPRGEWITVGLALKTQFPDDPDGAAGLFDRWSSGELWKGEPLVTDFYPGAEAVLAEWATFSDPTRRAHPVRFRTVLAKALQSGRFKMTDITDPGSATNAQFIWLKEQCEKHLAMRGLTLNAANALCYAEKPAQLIRLTTEELAAELAHEFNHHQKGLTIQKVKETIDAILKPYGFARRMAMMRDLCGKPGDLRGAAEARKWLRALTGTERESDLMALGHWLWSVKVKQTGGVGDHHLMPILYGVLQGAGKSTAVKMLCAPWAELQTQITAEHFDPRSAPTFCNYAIGVWDEMQGIAKTEVGRLKNILTAAATSYRPMRSNENKDIPVLMCFIGTSNKTVATMIRDDSGSRRFYQIDCADTVDQAAINAIDYRLLWSWVSELEPSPMTKECRERMRVKQNLDGYKDSVERWLAEEEWGDAQVLNPAMGSSTILTKSDPAGWISTEEMFLRYGHWCRSAGEPTQSRESMGRKLKELKWESVQMRSGINRGKMGYVNKMARQENTWKGVNKYGIPI
jgi:hypothetical protein